MLKLNKSRVARGVAVGAVAGAFASGAALAGHEGDESKRRTETTWVDDGTQIKAISEDGLLKLIIDGEVVFETDDIKEIVDQAIAEADVRIKKLDAGGVIIFRGDEELVRIGDGSSWFVGDLDFGGVDWDGLDAEELAARAREMAERFGGQNQMFFAPDGAQPPVVMGINIGSADEAKVRLEKLGRLDGLKPDKVTVVLDAIEGLPARKAGLRGGDLIVELKGEKDVGPVKLREILRKSKPGEEVEVVVLRDGDEKKFTVELAPFEDGAFTFTGPGAVTVGDDGWAFSGAGRESLERLNEAMAEASKVMADLSMRLGEATGERREEITRQLERKGQELAELAEQLARKAAEQNFRFELDEGNFQWRFGDDTRTFDLPQLRFSPDSDNGKGFIIVEQDEDDRASNAANDERLDEAKDRLKRLEDRLERLERLLERLVDEQGGN